MSEERAWRRGGSGVEGNVRTAAVWSQVRALSESRQRELSRPLRVLDLGGGTGGLAVALAEQGHTVTVVDPSPDALASLSRRVAERRRSTALRQRAGGEDETRHDPVTPRVGIGRYTRLSGTERGGGGFGKH